MAKVEKIKNGRTEWEPVVSVQLSKREAAQILVAIAILPTTFINGNVYEQIVESSGVRNDDITNVRKKFDIEYPIGTGPQINAANKLLDFLYGEV